MPKCFHLEKGRRWKHNKGERERRTGYGEKEVIKSRKHGKGVEIGYGGRGEQHYEEEGEGNREDEREETESGDEEKEKLNI